MTKSEVLAELERLGIRAKRSLGQNFLINASVIGKIVAEVEAMPEGALYEIGPGLGSLTQSLIGLERPFTVIELDRIFAQKWRDKGLTVVETDALKWKWDHPPGSVLVSNLPYQISASLVIERSFDPSRFSRMVLMFQKEVAERVTARPSTKAYGLLSVIAQSFWSVSRVCDVGPGSFYPPPKVDSRVLRFDPIETAMPRSFLTFVKTAFSQRRKKLSSNLRKLGTWKDLNEEERKSIVAELGDARAEELSVEEFQELFLGIH